MTQKGSHPPARGVKRRAAAAAALACAAWHAQSPARAALISSTYNGGANDWSNASKWTPSAAFPNNGGGNTYDVTVGTGTVNLDVPITIEKLTLSGTAATITGPSNLTANGLFTWNATAVLTGAGATNANGGVSMGGLGSSMILNGRTVNFAAGQSTAWGGGNLTLTSGSINNAGALTYTRDFVVTGSTAGAFNNAGSFTKSSGAGESKFANGVTFNNSGTATVSAGKLTLQSGGTHTGSFVIGTASTLELGGLQSFGAASSISGTGSVNFSSLTAASINGRYDIAGTTTVGSGVVSFNALSAPLGLGSAATVNGTANFNTGADVNVPTLTISGGTVGGADAINVGGALSFVGGTVNGSGNVNANGTTTISGLTLNGRALNLAAGQTSTIVGTNAALTNATVNNAGSMSAQVNVAAIAGFGASAFNNLGSFTRATGTNEVQFSGMPFNNSGSVSAKTGKLTLIGGGTHTGSFSVDAGATLSFGGIQSFSAASSVTGAGDVQFSSLGAGSMNGAFNVTGTTSLIAGNVTFNPAAAPINCGAALNVSGGTATFNGTLGVNAASLSVNGILTGSDSFAISGPLTLGGTIGGSGTVSVGGASTWGGGTMSGAGKTAMLAGSSLAISGAGNKILSRAIDNAGNTSWTSGLVNFIGGTFNNLPGATFNASSANSLFNSGGTNAFNNDGDFSKTSASISIIGIPFNNSATGKVTVNEGTLGLVGGGQNLGQIDVGVDGTLRLGSTFNQTAGGKIGGAGTLVFNQAAVVFDNNLVFEGKLLFDGSTATVKAMTSAAAYTLDRSTITVAATGTVVAGLSGLTFMGTSNSSVILAPGATGTSTGKLTLGGDVFVTATAGTASINTANFGVQTPIPGTIDLGGPAVDRTFDVSNGSAAADAVVSARVTNGQLTKSGGGLLRLSAANTLTGITVTGGTLEATDTAALGTGAVKLMGGNLSLKSDTDPAAFANSVEARADATITVDRISAGTTFRIRLNQLAVSNNSRVTLNGANRTLEVGGLTLDGIATFDNSVALTVGFAGSGGAITGVTPESGFTKSDGASKMTLAGPVANTYTGLTRVNAGTLELNKPAGVTAIPGDLTVAGTGVVRLLNANQIADTSAVSATNAGTLLDLNGKSETVRSLAVVNAAVTLGAASPAGSSVFRTGGLSIAGGTGKLDVGANRLIVDYAAGAPSPIGGIRQMIAGAYAGGPWTGAAGLTSSAAAAAPSMALGYAEAAAVLGPNGGTFAGQSVTGPAVLVRYTLSGDATLDGSVDFNDLVRLAQNYNVTDGARTWFDGDYNYDGNVDFNDLVKLAQNYNVSLPGQPVPGAPAGFGGDLAAAFAAVPEPSAVAGFAIGLGALLGRRRRR